MMSNVQWAMDQPMDVNLVSRLWKKLSPDALLCVQLFKFMKVAKLVVVQIMGSMEDERTFSTPTFMKTKLQNWLCEHLDLVVCMFAQPFYTINTFPYDDAITI
jgi:trans-aconitate methyltransferase